MKAVLINGSPRKKNWNTILLLEETARSLQEEGFETEIINLYDYLYKGCISCFLCKRKKDIPKHICEYKDELTPVLEKCREADTLVIGSPVYFSLPTGETRSFLERFLFPWTSYMVDEKGERKKIFEGCIPSAFIYTMNCSEEIYEMIGYKELLEATPAALTNITGPCEILNVYDTYQFRDYHQYESSMFDPERKLERKEKQFPEDLKNAYKLGKRLAERVRELK